MTAKRQFFSVKVHKIELSIEDDEFLTVKLSFWFRFRSAILACNERRGWLAHCPYKIHHCEPKKAPKVF